MIMTDYFVNSGLLGVLIILNLYCVLRGVVYHD